MAHHLEAVELIALRRTLLALVSPNFPAMKPVSSNKSANVEESEQIAVHSKRHVSIRYAEPAKFPCRLIRPLMTWRLLIR